MLHEEDVLLGKQIRTIIYLPQLTVRHIRLCMEFPLADGSRMVLKRTKTVGPPVLFWRKREAAVLDELIRPHNRRPIFLNIHVFKIGRCLGTELFGFQISALLTELGEWQILFAYGFLDVLISLLNKILNTFFVGPAHYFFELTVSFEEADLIIKINRLRNFRVSYPFQHGNIFFIDFLFFALPFLKIKRPVNPRSLGDEARVMGIDTGRFDSKSGALFDPGTRDRELCALGDGSELLDESSVLPILLFPYLNVFKTFGLLELLMRLLYYFDLLGNVLVADRLLFVF